VLVAVQNLAAVTAIASPWSCMLVVSFLSIFICFVYRPRMSIVCANFILASKTHMSCGVGFPTGGRRKRCSDSPTGSVRVQHSTALRRLVNTPRLRANARRWSHPPPPAVQVKEMRNSIPT
jgi:hypothetical protein